MLLNPVKKKSSLYIFKENPSQRSISELEVFNGYCYRLLLGDCHAKVKAIHGPQGEKTGLVTKMYSDFVSYQDFYRLNGPYPEKYKAFETMLLETEIVKIWVASYVEEENDLHPGNFGFATIQGTLKAVKIDDDQSTWPLTAKYAEVDPVKGRLLAVE